MTVPLGQLVGSRPSSARVWDRLRFGKDNYAEDRDAVDAALQVFPGLLDVAVRSGEFVDRAVRHVVGGLGVSQVLDIGPGIPVVDAGAPCTHQVARQAAGRRARVAYVDIDPAVLAYRWGRCCVDRAAEVAAVEADLGRPAEVLARAGRVLDLDEPVVVVLSHVLSWLPPQTEAVRTVQVLLAGLAPGSHLVVAEPMAGLVGEPVQAALDAMAALGAPAARARDHRQFCELLLGLHALAPGVVPVSQWRRGRRADALAVAALGAVARKPWPEPSAPAPGGRR